MTAEERFDQFIIARPDLKELLNYRSIIISLMYYAVMDERIEMRKKARQRCGDSTRLTRVYVD